MNKAYVDRDANGIISLYMYESERDIGVVMLEKCKRPSIEVLKNQSEWDFPKVGEKVYVNGFWMGTCKRNN